MVRTNAVIVESGAERRQAWWLHVFYRCEKSGGLVVVMVVP